MTKCDILGCGEDATFHLKIKITFRDMTDETYRCDEHKKPTQKVLKSENI